MVIENVNHQKRCKPIISDTALKLEEPIALMIEDWKSRLKMKITNNQLVYSE